MNQDFVQNYLVVEVFVVLVVLNLLNVPNGILIVHLNLLSLHFLEVQEHDALHLFMNIA